MIDVVMKGSKADCEEFRVKASILDAVSGKSMFEATFQPRYGFLVIQGGLARLVDNINHCTMCTLDSFFSFRPRVVVDIYLRNAHNDHREEIMRTWYT